MHRHWYDANFISNFLFKFYVLSADKISNFARRICKSWIFLFRILSKWTKKIFKYNYNYYNKIFAKIFQLFLPCIWLLLVLHRPDPSLQRFSSLYSSSKYQLAFIICHGFSLVLHVLVSNIIFLHLLVSHLLDLITPDFHYFVLHTIVLHPLVLYLPGLHHHWNGAHL